MNPTIRRALIVSGFVVVVVGFFFVIWYIFFRSGVPIVNNNRRGGITNGLPNPQNGNLNRALPGQNVNALPAVNVPLSTASTVADGGPTFTTQVTKDKADSLIVNPDGGNLEYYDRTTGQFFKVSPDGASQTPLTSDVYHDVQSVAWAPNGNKAILGFPDGSKILYDFSTKKQVTLPNELNGFSFSPQSDQIASKYLDATNSENQWLVVSNPDGTDSQTAEHLGANADKVTVSWSPNNQIIGMYEKPTNLDQSEMIFLGANNENFPSVTIAGRGFIPNWSPDGQKLLYSAYSAVTNDNPHLYLMNASPTSLGSQSYDLNLDTRADKCAWAPSGSTIYCAVPYYLAAGSGPQPELSAGIPDNIFRIDLRTGAAQIIARPVDQNKSQRFSISSLQVSADESALFFVDSVTGTTQRIALR